jgi:succinate dehydrogenase / fumarate reductase flavoprotein subunit
VDYNLESTIGGLFVLGEANFSDHGANRLGASALMQGLADGYFVLPATIGDFLAREGNNTVGIESQAFKSAETEVNEKIKKLLNIKGERTPDSFHRELGRIVWDHCGMGRNEAGLKQALEEIPKLRDQFWKNLKVLPGRNDQVNQTLEKAGRVADFLEFAEVLVTDALHRSESCGGHYREESQTEEGEALRDDEHFAYVAAWEHAGEGKPPVLHKEPLTFEEVSLTQRSYK